MSEEPFQQSIPAAYFQDLYAADPDPWRFATSPYERQKYAATLSALPRDRYARALEVGCAIGVLTAALAPRCTELLAIDVVAQALDEARRRCAAQPNIEFQQLRLPDERPAGTFDLILLSEVLYYFDASELRQAAQLSLELSLPGTDFVLVHWRRWAPYPLTGDAAVAGFAAELGTALEPLAATQNADYRLDVFRRR